MFRLLWVDDYHAPPTVSHCPEVGSDPDSLFRHGTNGGGSLFHQTKGREAAPQGGPESAPADSGGRSVQRSPSEAFSLAVCCRPQTAQTRPVQGQASVQDAHKGRRAAFSGPETKRRRAVGKPGEGRLSREAQAVPWLSRRPSTRGRAGDFPRSGISLPEGGGLEGESPKGESPGEFPAELGGRRTFPGTREWPTDRPRRHSSPEGGSAFKPRQAKLAGWRSLVAGVVVRGGGGKADQAGISRTSSPGILAPGA